MENKKNVSRKPETLSSKLGLSDFLLLRGKKGAMTARR